MKTALTLCTLLFCLGAVRPTEANAQKSAAPSISTNATVELSGSNGRHATLTEDALQQLPRQTVEVHNTHTGKTETYQGVELATLLARIQAPLGAQLYGAALTMYVVAVGTDKYQAVYSLAEVDPAFHSGTVIVADRENGQPIDAKDGPFKLVNTEDKRPARWVRNLASLQLGTAH